MFAFIHTLIVANLLPFLVPGFMYSDTTGRYGLGSATGLARIRLKPSSGRPISCLPSEHDSSWGLFLWHHVDFVVFSEDSGWPYNLDTQLFGRPAQLTLPAPERVLLLPAPKRVLTLPAPRPILTLPAPERMLTLPAPKVVLSLPAPPLVLSLPAPPLVLSLPAPKPVLLLDAPTLSNWYLTWAYINQRSRPVMAFLRSLVHLVSNHARNVSSLDWYPAATSLYMVALALVPHYVGRRLFGGLPGSGYPLDRDASDESADWNWERAVESTDESGSESDSGSDDNSAGSYSVEGDADDDEGSVAAGDEAAAGSEDAKEVEKAQGGVEEESDEGGKDGAEVEGEQTKEEIEEEKAGKAEESEENDVAPMSDMPKGPGIESTDDQEGWTVVTHRKFQAPRSSQANTAGTPKQRRKANMKKDKALTPRQLWERRPRPKMTV